MYVYQSFEPGLWTVGFYQPDSKWEPESDHGSSDEAAARVAWLNGSNRGELIMNDDYDNSVDDKAMLARFTTQSLTPAEHRARAEKDLDKMRGHSSGSPTYHGYALSAIAHVLAAVAEYLQPPPEQDIPGLPEGWRITTAQSEKGAQLWRYELTGPGIETEHSPYRYGESGTALMAGLRYAGTVPEPVPEPQGSAYDHSMGRHEDCKHTREGSS